ncbi:type VII secretion-associated serine protease mycosin [Streptomyces sp. ISL-12]|uniref:type VII secretion-associated serine protease mycosin n=1 Tax=Streptomyces sp. ISL-12 TaxID=2819177 RepID=UPI001BEA698D|nr:type VII secretion-associated serine protease mycosin [Streptomyces sp. ISL-12]MBT2409622.1 type VII secretion-associated serine protease mycosin [Streptomyces sp. ISL-12]
MTNTRDGQGPDITDDALPVKIKRESHQRVLSMTGAVALAGALLVTTATPASADYIRDRQWALEAFAAEDVWAESQGEGVTVAVIDSGVDPNHPDMTGQVLGGKDFTGGGDAHEDVIGHGTKMASIIAAHGHGTDNSSGVVGLAPRAKILPLRTLQTRQDKNLDETWAAAVRYAVDHGAQVINMSFGASGGSGTISVGRDAIAYAQAHDVVVVAAAGNEGINAVIEPAALPGVVSVGAIDAHANLWEDSNTGEDLVLTAPGVDIVGANATMDNGYGVASGTSEATAFVSAAAALVRSKHPGLTAGQVINRLIKSATFAHHEGLTAPDEEYGYGMVRPYSALTMDIPAGPAENPLGQMQIGSGSGGAPRPTPSPASAAETQPSFRSSLIIAGASGVAVLLAVAAVIFAVSRRRNRGNALGKTPGYGTVQPPQPPIGHPPYPGPGTPQTYPVPPGPAPQHPHYTQQRPPQER